MYFQFRNSANPSNFEKRKGFKTNLRKSTPQRLRTQENTEKKIIIKFIEVAAHIQNFLKFKRKMDTKITDFKMEII